MSDVAERIEAIGKAFRPGDSVILRMRGRVTEELVARTSEAAQEFTRRSGVHLLIITDDVEVVLVEPKEVPA